ncbi:MAG TPA: bifunctional nicotinamidase/pyrazinamidase [Bacteroides sp.]|nr:bifunctional nicotinamidase/pyrazinamidase [Bacteroides sp.]
MNALLLIDIQKDFLPGGSLEVPEGDKIIPVVNEIQEYFDIVVATQDWHPEDHGSFASNHPGKKPGDKVALDGVEQILWPDHCIQQSEGAEFADDLNMERVQNIIKKGTDPDIDSYSGFFDNKHRRATGLHEYLREKDVDTVTIVGLAADVCVRYTALDAMELGYKVFLVRNATRAVDGDEALENTLRELRKEGAGVVDSSGIKDILIDS